MPFKDIDCAVHIGVDHGSALVTIIEATMNTIGFTPYAAYAACLARIFLGFLNNTDEGQ
jgi:hypothetical protein